MTHTRYAPSFNGTSVHRIPTLTERIALTLIAREQSLRTRTRPPVTVRKFSWEADA